MLEKTATIKRFEYLPLGNELKAQTDIVKKQFQKRDNIFEFYEIFKKEEPTFKDYNQPNLIYNKKYNFYKYYGDSKIFETFHSN